MHERSRSDYLSAAMTAMNDVFRSSTADERRVNRLAYESFLRQAHASPWVRPVLRVVA